MTDNEIIKALKCHISNSLLDCEECPFNAMNRGFAQCHIELFNSLYDLINRQKAEIERLKDFNQNLRV